VCELDLLVETLDLAVALVAVAIGWRRSPREHD
jgi:hypothetical protein